MTVYVDELTQPQSTLLRLVPGSSRCHLLADDINELYSIAYDLGLKRRAFDDGGRHPFFLINASQRAEALRRGAIATTNDECRALGLLEAGRDQPVRRRQHLVVSQSAVVPVAPSSAALASNGASSAPASTWCPNPLPMRGTVRTNGRVIADYLPAGEGDLVPWRTRTVDGRSLPPLPHVQVYKPGWRELGNLAHLGQAVERLRFFRPGDPVPPDVDAVITPDGRTWAEVEWTGGAFDSWEEFLEMHGAAIAVPVARLLQDAVRQGVPLPAAPHRSALPAARG